MNDKYRIEPKTLLTTSAIASGVEASGSIGSAGDGFVYEITSISVPFTTGSDAATRIPAFQFLDSSGNILMEIGVISSGIITGKATRLSAVTGLTSRIYGDHDNVIELPSLQGEGMLVAGGTVVRTVTTSLDSTGNSDQYGIMNIYGRQLRKLR